MMYQLTSEAGILDIVARTSDRSVDSILSVSDDTTLRNLATAYEENQRSRKVDLGFNAFALVSDVYYRENFHSDILNAILNPSGPHGQGVLYLRLFLEFLRDCHGVPLEIHGYARAKIVRESGRIDLLIFDDSSKRAIIIENKINGAWDMDRQVVRYLETVEDVRGYFCDAIVYLTLNVRKTPHTHGWTEAERARVNPLLRLIVAFDDSPKNLCHGWLARCNEATQDDAVAHVIHQYIQLILKMGQEAMCKPLMKEYYDLMMDDERYKAVLTLTSMMNELPEFRCHGIYNSVLESHSPFKRLSIFNRTIFYLEGLAIEGGGRIKIQVETTWNDLTRVSFWDNNDDEGALPDRILNEIGLSGEFSEKYGKWRTRSFQFPSEEGSLQEFLVKFLKYLDEYVESAKRVRIEN